MRVYISGKLSKPYQQSFLPAGLWFATEDNEDLEVSETCIRLDGHLIECAMEGDEFSCRWKGVDLCFLDEDGTYIETESFTVKEFMDIIKDNNMRLINMDVYCNSDTDIEITNVKLIDMYSEFDLDEKLIDKIEFVA